MGINISQGVKNRIQKLVNAGKVTFIMNHLIYHCKGGSFDVGSEEDLVSVWVRIRAYQSKFGV